LHFFERARTDYLRLCGISHASLNNAEYGEALAWVVRHLSIEFKRSARIDDLLTVQTQIEKIIGARILMTQAILKDNDVLCHASVEIVLVNGSGKPRRFPQDWIKKLII
jgi:acyl-CoA thioester hydrolase